MPTNAEMIATIKSQTLARIVELTEDHNPTYNIDGQNISWTAYLKQLQDTVKWCDEALAAAAPFELRSFGYS